MARKPSKKVLDNARLLKEYASWIYCTHCNKTVAYLCYVTYDNFNFKFECNCGSKGSVEISFDEIVSEKSTLPLVSVKNRLCCPNDESALLTIVEKNIKSCDCSIACVCCKNEFSVSL